MHTRRDLLQLGASGLTAAVAGTGVMASDMAACREGSRTKPGI